MLTIGEALERILGQTSERLKDTVDTLKCGSAAEPVKAVGVTFLIDEAVIGQAAAAGCNLIVTHEPTFYGHWDDVAKLADDPVYTRKKALLAQHGIAVFRYHDHMHMHRPDLIATGVLEALGWQGKAQLLEDPQGPWYTGLVTLPETTVGAVAAHVKHALGDGPINLVGAVARKVHTVALAEGASGFEMHRQMALKLRPDLLIVGEVNEWETPVWAADGQEAGAPALMVIGHQRSEEAGMAYCAKWLTSLLPEVPVIFLPKPPTYTTL